MKRTTKARRRGEAGFSLIELMISLAVTIVVTGLAVGLLVGSFKVRVREDRKSDAISDVRRTLGAMTREMANAGYGLTGETLPANGIVAADSNSNSIRILSNADRFTGGATPDSPSSPDEDVIYRFVNDATTGRRYIVRFDVNNTDAVPTVLADRIDSFIIRYYPQKVTYTTRTCDIEDAQDSAGHIVYEVPPDQATYVVVSACVQLPAARQFGQSSNDQPVMQQLTSDVQLRNATVNVY